MMIMLYEIGQKPTKFQIKEGEEAYNVKDGITYTKDKWGDIIIVGQTGPIAFDLLNAWVDYTGAFSNTPAGYIRQGKIVTLHGLVKDGTTNVSPIATLPEGFRPKNTLILSVISNQVACRLDITDAGVIYASATASTTWISLAGITFSIA